MRQSWCQRVHGGTWHKQPIQPIQDLVPIWSVHGEFRRVMAKILPPEVARVGGGESGDRSYSQTRHRRKRHNLARMMILPLVRWPLEPA